MGDFSGHGFNSNADSEVFMAPLGLGGPELVCRDLYFAHRVVFDTIFHFFLPYPLHEIKSEDR